MSWLRASHLNWALYFLWISMRNLIESLNLLSGIREQITKKEIIDSLESQLCSTNRTLDVFGEIDELNLSELPGIYYFEARFPFKTQKKFNEFGDKWGRYRAKEKLPIGISRFYENRASRHLKTVESEGFVPFYLGKAQNIEARIVEHLNGSTTSDTYSLKLKSRPKIIEGIEFKISYIELDINIDAYFGVELLERSLRERLNPIIGKQ